MAREALADEKVVAAIRRDFIPVLLDLDEEIEWKERHGVSSIPVIHWTYATGEVVATTEDVQPVARVLEDMQTTLEFLADDE